jgi:hypothetical protein
VFWQVALGSGKHFAALSFEKPKGEAFKSSQIFAYCISSLTCFVI